MAGARLLKPIDQVQHGRLFLYLEDKFNNLNRRYERGLNWSLKHRWAIVLVAFLSLGLSFYFFANLQKEFLPEEDKGRLLGLVIAPEGSTILLAD